MRAAPQPLEQMLEKAWDAQIFGSKDGLATTLGWRLVYHTLRSKGSRSGFPDRVLVRDRVIFAELKREKKTATPISSHQREWLDGLARGGAEVYLWRPSDLDEIARILGTPLGFCRYIEGTASFDKPPYLVGFFDRAWIPRSIWVPGAGRADEAGVAS